MQRSGLYIVVMTHTVFNHIIMQRSGLCIVVMTHTVFNNIIMQRSGMYIVTRILCWKLIVDGTNNIWNLIISQKIFIHVYITLKKRIKYACQLSVNTSEVGVHIYAKIITWFPSKSQYILRKTSVLSRSDKVLYV